MADELITGYELARRLGISESMVRKHKANGLFRCVRHGAHRGRYRWRECETAYRNERDPDKAIAGAISAAGGRTDAVAPGLPESSLVRARTAQATLKAQREKLALDKARGELIATADAIRAARAVISVVLERLDGAPSQIGARAAGMDAVAIERVARDVLNACRNEIAAVGPAIVGVADAGH